MIVKRGDIVLARYPHTSGGRGKKRPCVVIQSDAYNTHVPHMAVVEITTNLALVADPTCLFIDISTPEGQATGLTRNSIAFCLLLGAINTARIDQVIGSLSPALLARLDSCLQAALGLP